MCGALLQDVRYAARHLRRSPGFALAAILTLTFGIAANTVMFSVLNALVLRSMPVRDPARLVAVQSFSPQGQLRGTPITAVGVLDAESGPLEGICGYNGGVVLATEANGMPTQAVIESVTGHCLSMLGVPPLLGRLLTTEDAPLTSNGNRVAVIGHRFWQRMFGGDPQVIGRTFRTEGIEMRIVGVMPPGFHGFQIDTGVDIISPFQTVISSTGRVPNATHIIGRLRPGVTLDQARAELLARWPALLDAVIPASLSATERGAQRHVHTRVELIGMGLSSLRERYARQLTIITGLTAVLLLVTCINLGGLLLSRVAARGGELAVRIALGASQQRLVQQLLAESLMISLAATLLAIALARAAIGPLASLLPGGVMERAVTLTPDLRVLGIIALTGVGCGCLTSTLPIWVAARRRTAVSVRWDRTIAGTTNRWGKILLVAQVALSVVLLFGAGLLTRSLHALLNVDPGFSTADILTVRLMPLPGAYRDLDSASYYPALVERVSALPGVRSAGYARLFPTYVEEASGMQAIAFVGQPAGGETKAVFDTTSPQFFETVGIPLLRGRVTSWNDNMKTAPVAVVSESLARALAPDGDVLGRRIRYGADRTRQNIEIVGIVGNATLGNLRATDVAVMYRPALQEGRFAYYPTLQVATSGDPLAVAETVRQTLLGMGREYAHSVAMLEEVVGRGAAPERISAVIALSVAGLAVLLTVVGVFGLFAYAVVRRRREFGVRLAIGAAPMSVLAMIVREGFVLTLAGVAIGVPCALLAARALRSLMYGVTASDPWTLAVSAAFFVLIGVSAGLLPARRAATTDPMEALRE